MTEFEDREKGFERKFALDAELEFKVTARRNKLLGLWAAEMLGKKGEDAEAYAKSVVVADMETKGDDDVVGKLMADFAAAGQSLSAADVRAKMEALLPEARKQIEG